MSRYNELGQWKPFIHGGDEAFAESAAWQLAGQDVDVFSSLFYVFYTGARVLEFVACTSVELPTQDAYFWNGKLHLWKCPRVYPIQNEVVYDGSWHMTGPDVTQVQEGLRAIPQVLNRIAFAFRSSVQWRTKYNYVNYDTRSFATPAEADLPLLDRFLGPVGSEEEWAVIDSAIDWYNRARGANNVFTRFLGYYIALESTAVAIATSSVNFDLNIQKETKAESRDRRKACISELHEDLYAKDPARFVRTAYFDCVESLKTQVARVLKAVFGEESLATAAVVGNASNKKPLVILRSEIAHGRYSMSNPEHRAEVASRVGEMAEITRQFIARLLLRLRPEDEIPGWSNRFIAGLPADDPRHLWIADRRFIEAKEWSIRPEWCS